ncbi:hypothetical protein F4861DRAFT_533679 [Xylaria intraflava]|nr:hypothetical protein F4861DRAFT_533679 [Xylaria intraflava]
MRSFLILGAAALVYAQADSTGYLPGEPSCAVPCLTSAIAAAGCQLSDLSCQCGPTKSAIADKVSGCLIEACSNSADIGSAINVGEAICSSFLAGSLTFTEPGQPTQTPTSVSGSAGSATDTSMITTPPPTNSGAESTGTASNGTAASSGSGTHTGSGSMSITTHGTHTDTIIGPLKTTSAESSSGSHNGAAATPAKINAGILAGIMGAAVLL